MFTNYTPMQYLAIDIANQYGHGLDKKVYEKRIEWVKENIDDLENGNAQAENPFLYAKAVNALRQSQAGIATGHIVGFDAVCSGLQLMSAVMGCKKGMALTGLIHSNKRTDAYTLLTKAMNGLLEEDITVSRKDAKAAVMTSFYGSQAVPKEVFGDLVEVFYQTLEQECPGAYQLLQLLKQAWNPDVDRNIWQLPDGHMAMVPVVATIEKKIHVAELKYTPIVTVQVVEPQDYGISLIANCIHSLDAYVLRTLVRRCNYSAKVLTNARRYLMTAYMSNSESDQSRTFKDTGMADMTMLDVDVHIMSTYPEAMRAKLIRMIDMALEHKPFQIVTIHDQFGASPVNLNQMRRVYADIIGDLVESTLIDDLLNQLYQDNDTIDKYGNVQELAAVVRQSNYGIC